MPVDKPIAAGPLRPATAAASVGSVSASHQAPDFRSLPEDITHEVLDKMASKAQTSLIVADKRIWELSKKHPALSAATRLTHFFMGQTSALLESVHDRLVALGKLTCIGFMGGVLEGFHHSIKADLQAIRRLLQRFEQAMGEDRTEGMADAHRGQRRRLETAELRLSTLQWQAGRVRIYW